MRFFKDLFSDSLTVSAGTHIFYKKQDKLYYNLDNNPNLLTTGRPTTKNLFLKSGGVDDCTLIIIKDHKHETYRFFHISLLDNLFLTDKFACQKDQQEKYNYPNIFPLGREFVTLMPFYFHNEKVAEWTSYKKDSELSIIIIKNKNSFGGVSDLNNEYFQSICNIIKNSLPYKLGEKIKYTHYINSEITNNNEEINYNDNLYNFNETKNINHYINPEIINNDEQIYLVATLFTNNDSLVLESKKSGKTIKEIKYENIFNTSILREPINSREINLP